MTEFEKGAEPLASPLSRFDPRRAVSRVVISLAFGLITSLGFHSQYSTVIAALAGWNVGGFVLLSLAWLAIFRSDAVVTRTRAGAEDPGRTAVYALVTLTSFVSLLSATIFSRRAKTLAVGDEALLIGLCLFTVALAWLLTQTSFTLRYAHLYYREDAEGIGGVEFPGHAAPTYFDFAYFAFTVGMCFQVSDCVVVSPQIRRVVLIHAALSFAYTTVILAFTLNLIFGAATG